MKVAIFENEYDSVRFAFETANLIHFNNEIEFQVYPSSQSANLDEIGNFDIIFMDIDLSTRSMQDGYSLITYLINKDLSFSKKIIILTGNNKINASLKERGIDISQMQVLLKPTNYIDISNAIIKVRPQAV